MKSFLTKIVVTASFFLLTALAFEAHAQTTAHEQVAAFYSDFYVLQIKPMKFQITYNYPVTDRVQVRILDAFGSLLFGEKVLVYKKYNKLFDLSVFRDGNYTFELTDGEKEYRQSINIITTTTRTVSVKGNEGIIVAGF